jgi:hypothetical protein
MAILTDITGKSIRENLNRIARAVNNLNDTHVAPFASIAKTKFSTTLVTQKEVSVTRKAASSVTTLVRNDENCDYHIPRSIGSASNFFRIQLSLGALSFFTGGIERAYVDATGWHSGIAPAGSAITKAEIFFVPDDSIWAVRLDGVDRAFVDPFDASVFVNALASLTRTLSTGASIDFSVANRINFRNNGAVIGHITTGGFFAGA